VWRVLAKSVIGTSHRRLGTACQDSWFSHRMSIGDDECLIIACADGAGSASEGGLGAAMACQAFCLRARDALSCDVRVADLDAARVLDWYRQVRDELSEEAARRSIRPRELACTLLTAVLSPDIASFAQVGDGAIVLVPRRSGSDRSRRATS